MNETTYDANERSAKERILRFGITVERKGGAKLVLIADWLLLVMLQ